MIPRQPSQLVLHWKKRAATLRLETYALFLAYKDPRTPWYARAAALIVAAYAFSPLDLIPDFIPILGYLDDLILLPLGILLAVRLIPSEVMSDCRSLARERTGSVRSLNRYAMILMLLSWLAILSVLALILLRLT